MNRNKYIARNTVFLYIRMAMVMLVTLYTSRVVIAELGLTDYGVFVVVGAVVSLLEFMNSCMVGSTQRFLNYELGRNENNIEPLKDIFSTALTVHSMIAAVVLVVAETAGLWMVNYVLVIPPESIPAANVLYQCTIGMFIVTVLRAPFNAAIIAREKMKVFAALGVLEVGLKLACAFALILIPSGKLAAYGVLMLGVQLTVAGCYVGWCIYHYPECSLRWRYIPHLFREMLRFAGWNMLETLAGLLRVQGAGILLNLYFGPTINAAKGVTDQLRTAITSLNTNFQIALNPQIVKDYAAGRLSEMELLTYRGLKFSTLLLWIVSLPVMLNAETILCIWLEEVPPYSAIFLVLILFECIAGCLSGSPMMTAIGATGRIRNYQIAVSTLISLFIPAAWLGLHFGLSPESIFVVGISVNLLACFVKIRFCRLLLGFSGAFYVRYVILPVGAVVALSVVSALTAKIWLDSIGLSPVAILIVSSCLSVGVVICASWWIAFTPEERGVISGFIARKIR